MEPRGSPHRPTNHPINLMLPLLPALAHSPALGAALGAALRGPEEPLAIFAHMTFEEAHAAATQEL